MNTKVEDYLESKGWVVECKSPLEIRNEDGSFVTGIAALEIIKKAAKKLKVSSDELWK